MVAVTAAAQETKTIMRQTGKDNFTIANGRNYVNYGIVGDDKRITINATGNIIPVGCKLQIQCTLLNERIAATYLFIDQLTDRTTHKEVKNFSVNDDISVMFNGAYQIWIDQHNKVVKYN